MRYSNSWKTSLQLIVVSFLAFSSCKNYPVFKGDYARVEVGPGPEDIVLDTSNGMERLIVSCSERRSGDYSKNGFYEYNIQSTKLRRLPLEGLPDSIQFRPHGVDIGFNAGKRILYCVNHEKNEEAYPPKGRQSILVFELMNDKVIFLEQLTNEVLISPNDVCTDHKGGIYVSNDSGERNNFFEKLFEMRRSTVVHFDGKKWQYVGGKFKYANGVGVKDNRLYVTGTQEKSVISYQISENGELSDKLEIPSLKGNDNITFFGDKLVTTAHLDFMKFLKHVKHKDKPSPCAVYSIDINTQELDTLYMDNGTVLSAASTGLIYNGNLYVSQVFNPFILEIPLKR